MNLGFLYVCMVNTIYLFSFVETPREFIIAIIIMNLLKTSSIIAVYKHIFPVAKTLLGAAEVDCVKTYFGQEVLSRMPSTRHSLQPPDDKSQRTPASRYVLHKTH